MWYCIFNKACSQNTVVIPHCDSLWAIDYGLWTLWLWWIPWEQVKSCLPYWSGSAWISRRIWNFIFAIAQHWITDRLFARSSKRYLNRWTARYFRIRSNISIDRVNHSIGNTSIFLWLAIIIGSSWSKKRIDHVGRFLRADFDGQFTKFDRQVQKTRLADPIAKQSVSQAAFYRLYDGDNSGMYNVERGIRNLKFNNLKLRALQSLLWEITLFNDLSSF